MHLGVRETVSLRERACVSTRVECGTARVLTAFCRPFLQMKPSCPASNLYMLLLIVLASLAIPGSASDPPPWLLASTTRPGHCSVLPFLRAAPSGHYVMEYTQGGEHPA